MKTKRILTFVLTLPLLVSCNSNSTPIEDYIPANLPEYVDKNVGEIRTDGTYDYIDVYEISDFHGAVTYNKSNKNLGLTRLGSYFDKKRENNKGGTILISGGDMWQGSADSNLTRGNMVTYAMNYMGFDSMTMGNHEYDWGKSWIENNKAKANFPILAGNIYKKDSHTLDETFKLSTVVTRGDYKIGIIGTIGDNIIDSIYAHNVSDVYFEKEGPIVKAETERLRTEEGCDAVIWSSHRGLNEVYDEYSVNRLTCDMVFGGHTHETDSRETDRVAFLQTAPYAQSIAHGVLKINKATREVSSSEGYEVDIDPIANEYTEDASIKVIQDQYNRDFIDSVKGTKVAKLKSEFKIANLANFCVYSMKEYLKTSAEFKDREIVAAFHNLNGGVRKILPSGNIKYGDVYEAFPFDNEIVILGVYGAFLSSFYTISNQALWTSFTDAKQIEGEKIYYVLSTDYLANKASYHLNQYETLEHTELLVRDGVAETMKKMRTVNPDDFATKGEYVKPKGI